MKLVILLLFMVQVSAFAQAPDSLWSRTFGGSGYEECWSMEQAPEGGFVLGGFTESFTPFEDSYDFWMVRTNSSGDSLWSRTYGDSSVENCVSIKNTSDGGFILAGTKRAQGNGVGDYMLIKTNSSGDSLWSHTYGGPEEEACVSVIQTSDGGFLLAGETFENFFENGGWTNIWIVKTDAVGDCVWSRTVGLGSGYPFSIIQTDDGGFALSSFYYLSYPEYGFEGLNLWLLKMDDQGSSMWHRNYGAGGEIGYCLEQTSDGGFILAGSTTSFSVGESDYWLLKTNANGDSLWSKSFGGSSLDECSSVFETSDGGFAITGTTRSFGAGDLDIWIVKTNSVGDSIWSRTLGGNSIDVCHSGRQTFGGGYILAGRTYSFGSGLEDYWLIKLGPDNILPVELLSFTATPSNNRVTLNWSTGSETNVSHFEIDRDGAVLARVEATNQASGHSYTWLDDDVTNGQSYNYRLTSVDLDGSRVVHGTVEATPHETALPTQLTLSQNYPNPFNASTTIEYSLPEATNISLKLFNLAGQEVAELTSGAHAAGRHVVSLNASDLSSGIYFYRLDTPMRSVQQKMVLLK